MVAEAVTGIAAVSHNPLRHASNRSRSGVEWGSSCACPGAMRKPVARPCPSAIGRLWCHSPHGSGQALHEHLARAQIPFCGTCRFLVSPHSAPVKEGHSQRDAAFLHAVKQPFPGAGPSPADEDLRRLPGTQLLRDGPPLGSVLIPQRIAGIVSRSSLGGVLPLGRHASISGSSSSHCASDGITAPRAKTRKRQHRQSVQPTTGPSCLRYRVRYRAVLTYQFDPRPALGNPLPGSPIEFACGTFLG